MQPFGTFMWYDTQTMMPALIVATPASSAGPWRRPTPELLDALETRLPGVAVSWADSGSELSLTTAIGAARFLGARRAVVVAAWGTQHRLQSAPRLAGIETHWTETALTVETILAAYHEAVHVASGELQVAV